MKPQTNYQEILLLTKTRFSKNQFCERDGDLSAPLPQNVPAQLEVACWNGLLSEMLPDIIKRDSKLFLWQIENRESFLRISLGDQPPVIENFFSLDPDSFLCSRQMN